jgi:YbbR domain-containing protein
MPAGIKLDNIDSKTVTVNVEEYVTESKPVEIVLSGAGSGEEATIIKSSLTQIGVSGAESIVQKVAQVRVSGDLSKADLDKEVELTLAGEAVDASGKVIPGVKLAQESINVTAVMYQTKSVPLSVPVTGSIWEGAALSESRIPDSITIKGPASRLSQISEIKAKELKIDGLYETTVMDIEPILGDNVYEIDSAEPLQAMFVIAENGRLIYSYKASPVIAKNLADGTTASFVLPEGHKEISAVITGPVSTLRTLAAGDVAPTVDAAKREAGEYSVLLTPSRTVTGLSINFAPGSITMRIK